MFDLASLRLRFADPVREARFLDAYNRKYIAQARLAIGMGIVLVLLDSLVDYAAEPARSGVGNQIRLFVVVPMGIVGIVGSYVTRVRRGFQRYAAVWGLIAGLGLLGAMAALEVGGGQGLSSWVGLLNFVFIIVFAFVILGLQFRYACIIGVVFFVLFLVMLGLVSPLAVSRLAYYAYHLGTVVLLAMFISYWRERYIRRDFLLQGELEQEQGRADALLYNMLPRQVAERIKSGEYPIADSFGEVTILFADLVDFTALTGKLAPRHLMEVLNEVFSAFDRLVEDYGVEKVKTIGDAYMAMAGSTPRTDNSAEQAAEAAVGLAIDMLRVVGQAADKLGYDLQLRIGIHTGPVIAGVIGVSKYQYDVWGGTVNLASRMEETGVAGRIQVSETTYWRVRNKFTFEPRETLDVKGAGPLQTYLLVAPG